MSQDHAANHPHDIAGAPEPVTDVAEISDVADAAVRREGDAGTEDGSPAEPRLAEPQLSFADFDVHPDIVASLAEAGIVHPFPIQAMTLPVALAGHDIIGQAKTGTGKTLGFGVPILQRVVSPSDDGFEALKAPGRPQALVVVPTRELAVQVAGDLQQAGKRRGIRVVTVYGGRAYEPQVEALKRGAEVVVGTPGRLLDLSQQRALSLAHARTVVLDEADEMLDLGFLPDVEKIVAQVPAVRQTMLFSATMPGAIVTLARRYMTQPTHIRAMGEQEDGHTVKAIEQFVYRAHAMDKTEMLTRILQAKGRGLTIIFARTKRTAAKVSDDLTERGFAAAAIHGDLGQGAREQALRAFRNGKVDVLVATDVAARGIDVDNVTHVINYQCPEDEKVYLHRTGRTGRAGNTGVAVTFVDWDELSRWSMINRALDLGIPEPQETYSSSEHLFTDHDIPAAVTGRLAESEQTRAGLAAERLEDLGETGGRAARGSRRQQGAPPAREGRGASATRDTGPQAAGPKAANPKAASSKAASSKAATGGGRGRAGNRDSSAEPEATANRSPRRRQRRRTRGGQAVGGPAGQAGGTA